MKFKYLLTGYLLFFVAYAKANITAPDTSKKQLIEEIIALKLRLSKIEKEISILKMDSDGDGVPDVFDHCPNTPAGTLVDGSGCPLAFPQSDAGIDQKTTAEAPSFEGIRPAYELIPTPVKKINPKTKKSVKPAATATNQSKTATPVMQANTATQEERPAEKKYSSQALNDRYEQDDINQIEHNIKQSNKVYDLQYDMSVIIFVLVILIVITGLFLSYKQFEFNHEMVRNHQESKKAVVTLGPGAASVIKDKSAGKENETDIALSGNTNFEISKDGIKINSAVIGLIILAMSIAFFFLYLEFVYPIHQI